MCHVAVTSTSCHGGLYSHLRVQVLMQTAVNGFGTSEFSEKGKNQLKVRSPSGCLPITAVTVGNTSSASCFYIYYYCGLVHVVVYWSTGRKVLEVLLLWTSTCVSSRVNRMESSRGCARVCSASHSIVVGCTCRWVITTVHQWQGYTWCERLGLYSHRNEVMGGGTERKRYMWAAEGELDRAHHVLRVFNEKHFDGLEGGGNDPSRLLLQARDVHDRPAPPSIQSGSVIY